MSVIIEMGEFEVLLTAKGDKIGQWVRIWSGQEK